MIDLLNGKAIYEKVDMLRKEKGWTIYELAKKMGIAPTTLYNWRDRDSLPSLSLLDAACSAFGISVIDFLLDEEERLALDKEQREVMRLWSTLSKEQKMLVLNLMKNMR